jgi:predicted nucleotidyltransferase
MNTLVQALKQIVEDLNRRGDKWALVGGLAVSAQTEPRFTRDVDIVVTVLNDAEAEAFIRDLLSRKYRTIATVEQDATRRLSTVRFAPPGGDSAGVIVDLLFASSGIEPEIVAEAQVIEIMDGISLPVARIGHLLAIKILSRDDVNRPQDATDIQKLLAVSNDEELSVTKTSLGLIETRGFHRDKDLLADFEALLANQNAQRGAD